MKILVLAAALALAGCETPMERDTRLIAEEMRQDQQNIATKRAQQAEYRKTHPPTAPTLVELRDGSKFGLQIVAGPNANGINEAGQPTHLEPGEAVEFVSIDPDTDRTLVRRVAYNSYATVPRTELRARPYE